MSFLKARLAMAKPLPLRPNPLSSYPILSAPRDGRSGPALSLQLPQLPLRPRGLRTTWYKWLSDIVQALGLGSLGSRIGFNASQVDLVYIVWFPVDPSERILRISWGQSPRCIRAEVCLEADPARGAHLNAAILAHGSQILR